MSSLRWNLLICEVDLSLNTLIKLPFIHYGSLCRVFCAWGRFYSRGTPRLPRRVLVGAGSHRKLSAQIFLVVGVVESVTRPRFHDNVFAENARHFDCPSTPELRLRFPKIEQYGSSVS